MSTWIIDDDEASTPTSSCIFISARRGREREIRFCGTRRKDDDDVIGIICLASHVDVVLVLTPNNNSRFYSPNNFFGSKILQYIYFNIMSH